MKKFSIIIPAYNAQDCIGNCLDSIFAQDFTDFEIIIIDDHSTDATFAETQRIQQSHPTFTIKLQRNEKNLGVATTRNRGIELADGEFLLFVDADDRLTKSDVLTKLATRIDESEIRPDAVLFGGFIDYKTKKGKTYFKFYLRVGKHDHDLRFQMRHKIMHYTWLMCVRRDFLAKHGLKFQEDLQIYEDVIFRAQVLGWAKHIVTIAEFFYDYTRQISRSSLSCNHSNNLQHKLGNLKFAINRVGELADNGAIPDENQEDFRRFQRLYLLGALLIILNHTATRLLYRKNRS